MMAKVGASPTDHNQAQPIESTGLSLQLDVNMAWIADLVRLSPLSKTLKVLYGWFWKRFRNKPFPCPFLSLLAN